MIVTAWTGKAVCKICMCECVRKRGRETEVILKSRAAYYLLILYD